jgi:hypothetical protein
MPTETESLFDAEHAAFMQRGISISIASCGPDKMPSVARAAGCRVSADRRSVTILMSCKQACAVLADVRRTGAVAVVFSEPSTHRTVQLKGKGALITAPTDADLQVMANYRDAFEKELVPLGYEAAMIRTFLAIPSADVVALSFAPDAAFSQTPGPGAGQTLKVPA